MGRKPQKQRKRGGKGGGKAGNSTIPDDDDAECSQPPTLESGAAITAPSVPETATNAGASTGKPPAAEATTDISPPVQDTEFLMTVEELKQQGNALYVKDDSAAAIEKYGLAIEAFEASAGESPHAPEHRKALAVLYSNRAQAALALVRKSKPPGWRPGAPSSLPKELRLHGFRANADASQAVELDRQNAKAWLRRGQALLVMSVMQQRAKEAVECFKKAKACGLPPSLQSEAEQQGKCAQALFDQETPMPENCTIL